MEFDKEHLRHSKADLGEGAVTHKTCKKWFQRFRNGDIYLPNRERSGQPKKFEDEELKQLLEETPTQTEKELAQALKVTQQASTRQNSKDRSMSEGTEIIFRPNRNCF